MNPARLVLLLSLLAAGSPAGAQPAGAPPAGTQADELFRRGRELMAAGKIAEACDALEQSQQLAPKVTTLLNLAGCREKLGRLATARRLFSEAEQQTRAERDEAMAQLHKVALGHVTRLEPRLSKLTIRVPDEHKLDAIEILRDGAAVPAEVWNRELPIDGGTYTIVARAPGVEAWSTRVTIAIEADFKTVEVPDLRRKLDARPQGASSAPAPVTPMPPIVEGGERGLGLPIAVGAGAAALLGGGLALALWGRSTYDEAKAELTDQARRDALEASANRKLYVAQGLAVAGVGCAGVAVWLYLRQRGGRSEATVARAGRLMLVPTASGIGVGGRF